MNNSNIISFRDAFQRRDDAYINITKLAKQHYESTGKRRDVNLWLRNKRTQEDIEHLSSVTHKLVTELVQVVQGGEPEFQGTFVHPKLSIRFGTWLSSEFGYAVEVWFEDWIKERQFQEIEQVYAVKTQQLRESLLAEQSLIIEQAREEMRIEQANFAQEIHQAIALQQTSFAQEMHQAIREASSQGLIARQQTSLAQQVQQQVAVQQNNFAQELWQRFAHEHETEFNKVRQEWLNFYDEYTNQQKEVEALRLELDVFLHGKLEGVAPGWNPLVWKALPSQDKLHYWKKHKLEGWMPSEQFQIEQQNILSPAPLEEKILEQQQNELKQIMGKPTAEESKRIENLKNELLLKLDKNFEKC